MSLRTLEDHILVLANYLPGGRLFNAKGVSTSNLYKLLKGTAFEMLTADGLIKAYRQEIIPDLTEQFIDEWELAVGIPDACFPGNEDLATRRAHVLIKLAALGAQTTADFQAIVDLFTAVFTVGNAVDCPAGDSFPMVFPFLLGEAASVDDRFTILLKSSIPAGPLFPLTFPIDFSPDNEAGIAECLVRQLAPANCRVLLREV